MHNYKVGDMVAWQVGDVVEWQSKYWQFPHKPIPPFTNHVGKILAILEGTTTPQYKVRYHGAALIIQEFEINALIGGVVDLVVPESKPTECDCGAVKAKSGHSNWCSTNKGITNE